MRGTLGTDKDLEREARLCRSEGWTVEIDKSNKIRWENPDGEKFHTHLTMNQRSVRNALRKIRRARGL